jgi:hypothetical protein
MKTFFQLRESTLQEKTLELAGVTLQHMEHCPGAVAAFKRNLKDGASEADVAKAAKAVDNYLAIEDKAIKAGKATDDDVEEMEKRIDRAEKIIAQLGLEGHTYHDMHLDRVEDMVEDEDEDDEDEEDEDEDDDLKEKTLTPAEKKKREEIAQAIKRDNPDMPMDKKMAIATATAKRVAEAAPKIKGDFFKQQRQKDAEHAKAIGVSVKTGRKLPKKTMTSTQRSMASMRNEEVNELSKSTLGSYIKKANASAIGIGSGIGADAAKNRKAHPDDTRQLRNRMKGVQRATDRLTKEEVNEISDKMKDRYIQKSMGDHQHANAVRKDAESRGNTDLAAKMRARMKKRNQGMTRAFGGERD